MDLTVSMSKACFLLHTRRDDAYLSTLIPLSLDMQICSGIIALRLVWLNIQCMVTVTQQYHANENGILNKRRNHWKNSQ